MIIKFRVLLIGLIFVLIYVGLSYAYLNNSLESLHQAKYQEISKRMTRELEVLIKEKQEAVILLGISLAQIVKVQEALYEQDSTNLDLQEYTKLVNNNTSFESIWFQLVNKSGTSIYRSWTEKKGDSLIDVRLDLVDVIQEPKLVSSISTGIFDMTFKSTVPVYKNKDFVGVVETISSFNSIVVKLKDYKTETVLLVDKSYKKQLTDTFTNHFIQDYFVSSTSNSPLLMKQVVEKNIGNFLKINDFLVDKENSQLITLYKLPDVKGKEMGFFIMARALEDIDTTSIEQSKQGIILSQVVIFLVISGFLLYLYGVNYKNFIQKQRKTLEDTVVKKTKELKEKSEQMKYLAHHDYLTKLPNRLFFHEKLKQAIYDAEKKKQILGVLFLDLDRFKEINDSYGHETGDLLLQEITKKIKSIVREKDTVARLGGDEFTVMVEDTTKEKITKVAQKILQEIQKPIILDKVELFVTFSIGLSLYPQDGKSSELLLKYADTAMYKAKENGKNRYQFYNFGMTEMTISKVNLHNSLREAIKENQFEPYFQPKIDARTQKVIGLEALVRWVHPEKGMISPLEFIPFAEEVGIISEIDFAMLYASLKQMKKWHSKGLNTGRLSLNISSKQLEDFTCIDVFSDAITTLNFDSKFLEIEVTESQIMKNQAKSNKVLHQMKELGISIALDDFGTGYSSLSYLKNLPIDRLKIDRSFIQDIPFDTNDMAIVKTIITLAKNLELDIIAEGVETKGQLDFLVKEGCWNIQGYYYSKPLSASECETFLRANI